MDSNTRNEVKAQEILDSHNSKVIELSQEALTNPNLKPTDILAELRKSIEGEPERVFFQLEEPSAEVRVFQNPLLLHTIMAHSRSRHVREFRRVNSSWFRICNRNLIRYQDLKVQFTFIQEFRQYFKGSKERNELVDSDKSLKNLGILLEKNLNLWPSPKSTYSIKENFPCTSFTIWRFTLRGVLDVQEFFSNYGFLVKNLKIDMNINDYYPDDPFYQTPKEDFEKLLRLNLPQLEELYILSLPKCWNNETTIFSTFPPLQLETVKRFCVFYNDKFIQMNRLQEFFQAFPNLEKFNGGYFQMCLLNIFISLNKLCLIKHLDFSLNGDVQLFEQFSNLPGISLKHISLENRATGLALSMDSKRCSQILSKILQSNRTTLKSMMIDLSIGMLTLIDWPTLPNMTTVHVSHGISHLFYGLQSLPTNLVFDKVFPNLNYLNLRTIFGPPRGVESLLPFGPNFLESQAFSPSLRQLTLSSVYYNPEWIQMFEKSFPNIQRLRMAVLVNDILSQIWKWSTIEILALDICTGDNYPQNKFPFLDSQFTGLPTEECQRILKTPVEHRCSMQIEDPQEISITHMKKLRQLSIFFSLKRWDPKVELEQFHQLLSASITGNLALNKMPSLMEVNFASNMKSNYKIDGRTVSQIESRIRSDWDRFQFRVLVDLDLQEGSIL